MTTGEFMKTEKLGRKLDSLVAGLNAGRLKRKHFLRLIRDEGYAEKCRSASFVKGLIKEGRIKSSHSKTLLSLAQKNDSRDRKKETFRTSSSGSLRSIDLSASSEDFTDYGSEELDVSPYGLAKNDTLIKAAEQLSYRPANWKEIGKRLNDYFVPSSLGRFKGLVAEVHVCICLEDIAKNLDGFELDPRRFNLTHLDFEDKNHAVQVSHNGNNYCELDLVAVSGTLPVILEVKSGQYSGKNGAHNAMLEERISKIVGAVKDAFKTAAVGYVIVMPYDQIPESCDSHRQFTKNNGLVVPLYASRNEFCKDVGKFKKRLRR